MLFFAPEKLQIQSASEGREINKKILQDSIFTVKRKQNISNKIKTKSEL